MKNQPILFIDSGIGGLPYCADFLQKNPKENVYYLADTKNYPYGPKGKDELTDLLAVLILKVLKMIEPKIIALACNTATISAISQLRNEFPQIPFVGTVPAIKPAAIACNNGKVGVLGTARTIEDIKNLSLADDSCEIFGIAAPELVDFVEHDFDNAPDGKKKEAVKIYIERFREAKVDNIVLGCTHFLYLLEEFKREAAGLEIFDSLEGITKRLEFLLDENDNALRSQDGKTPSRKLLLTGRTTSLWEIRARRIGFALEEEF